MPNDIAPSTEEKFQALEMEGAEIDATARSLMAVLKFPNKGKYLELDNELARVHAAWKNAEEQRKELTVPLNKVLDRINEIASRTLTPLLRLKEDIRSKMQEYAREERAWEAKEKARIDAENRKKIEDARIEAAAKAEKQGDNRTAEALINKPVVLPKAEVATAASESKSSNRTVWKARVVDAKAFLHAVADGQIDGSYVEINVAAITRAARAMKGAFKMAGIEAYEDVEIGSGRQ